MRFRSHNSTHNSIKTDFTTTQIYNNHAPSVCDITYIAYTWEVQYFEIELLNLKRELLLEVV